MYILVDLLFIRKKSKEASIIPLIVVPRISRKTTFFQNSVCLSAEELSFGGWSLLDFFFGFFWVRFSYAARAF